MESRVMELSAKVEKLSRELSSTAKENARLRRLLASAEAMIKDISGGARSGNGAAGVRELTDQVEKLRHERKIIREKVSKMAMMLEKVYRK
jgi:outer membrane murein-binding lipoprotein Lpp